MKSWTLSIEAHVLPEDCDIDTLIEGLLDGIAEVPGIKGAVSFGNSSNHTVGTRFDLERDDVTEAADYGIQVFTTMIRQLGIEDFNVQKVWIAEDWMVDEAQLTEEQEIPA